MSNSKLNGAEVVANWLLPLPEPSGLMHDPLMGAVMFVATLLVIGEIARRAKFIPFAWMLVVGIGAPVLSGLPPMILLLLLMFPSGRTAFLSLARNIGEAPKRLIKGNKATS